MKIGIIGAGQIGGTLTRRFTALGHEVLVANSRGPETLSDLAAETGATAVSVPEAVRGVDLIVVTIPEKNIPSRVVTLSEIGPIWTINQRAKYLRFLASILAVVGKFRSV